MKWYLLKDRRQLGPFSKEEIVEGLNTEQFDLKDYLLPETAVKDQSSFAYVLVSSVVGPEVVFDIEKRKNKVTEGQEKEASTPSQFKVLSKEEQAARLKDLQSEFEKGLHSSELSQTKHNQSKVPATTGNIDAYSSASSFSQRVRVESSPLKWVLGGVGGLCLAIFLAFQMGFIGEKSSQQSGMTSNSVEMNKAPSSLSQQQRPSRAVVQRPSPSMNRLPSSQVQLPTPTTRRVEEAPPVVHTEEVAEDSSAEPVAQRNPAMMKKLIKQKRLKRKASTLSSEEEGASENGEDPEAAQEAEPGNDDENNIE